MIIVRSQERCTLVECENVVLYTPDADGDPFKVVYCSDTDEMYVLGGYPTREEAMAVIDQIHDFIEDPRGYRVFTMPEPGFFR